MSNPPDRKLYRCSQYRIIWSSLQCSILSLCVNVIILKQPIASRDPLPGLKPQQVRVYARPIYCHSILCRNDLVMTFDACDNRFVVLNSLHRQHCISLTNLSLPMLWNPVAVCLCYNYMSRHIVNKCYLASLTIPFSNSAGILSISCYTAC